MIRHEGLVRCARIGSDRRPGFDVCCAAPAIIRKTERALVEQLWCKREPEVAKAINAMLRNGLIRYRPGYDGEYLFSPKVPLKFLGFRIKHISGFDEHRAFRKAPPTKAEAGSPFHSIQVDVAAGASQLKNRAKKAHILEAWLTKGHPGLEIGDEPSHRSEKPAGNRENQMRRLVIAFSTSVILTIVVSVVIHPSPQIPTYARHGL